MARYRLGIRLESLGKPLRLALQVASSLGVSGVRVDAVGDLAPDNLSQTGRREIRNLLRSYHLELTALGCPLRHGLAVEQGLEARLAHVSKVLSLAYELGPRIVVTSAGAIPQEEANPARLILRDSLTSLGRHGERVGATLALEAGQEPPATLRTFLSTLTCGGLGVDVDPATLLMRGLDPYQCVRELSGLIVHVHPRDARVTGADRDAQEVPLGHGDIDWTAFLGALEEVGYHGWLTIKRGLSTDPVADIKAGVAFLRRLIG
jgi:sugar phosphate isomerase/epimerase